MFPSVTVTARHSWSDERLDDLNAKIEQRFDEVATRFDRVEADVRELRVELKGLRIETHAGFQSLQRTIVISFTAMTGSIVAAVLGAAIIG